MSKCDDHPEFWLFDDRPENFGTEFEELPHLRTAVNQLRADPARIARLEHDIRRPAEEWG